MKYCSLLGSWFRCDDSRHNRNHFVSTPDDEVLSGFKKVVLGDDTIVKVRLLSVISSASYDVTEQITASKGTLELIPMTVLGITVLHPNKRVVNAGCTAQTGE